MEKGNSDDDDDDDYDRCVLTAQSQIIVPTCSTTVERGNIDGEGDDDDDDDDDAGCVLTAQSQIIRSDMLYDCGER